ncbi:Fc receptor-like A [Passer montanus]|uniref:Fc receptor-like A n=1 Tax=Passer montanus TaxID=9160 RepID=UPI00196032D8|nr:Fc receptor-like A [Passer montanus]
MSVTGVRFYHGDKEVGRSLNGTELSLSPLQLHHSGRYSCGGWVDSKVAPWALSAPVTVTVHELFTVPVLEGPTEPNVGSPLNLSCLSTPSTLRPQAPLLHMFYRDRQVVGGPQGSPQLVVPAVGVSHSGNYSCQVRSKVGEVWKSSAWLRVMVRIAAGLSGSLLFLLLLLAVIGGWYQWHHRALRKQQERAPPEPLAPPEVGEVLYSDVVSTKKAGGPPRTTSPQVTYAELPRPHRRQRDPSDISENVL